MGVYELDGDSKPLRKYRLLTRLYTYWNHCGDVAHSASSRVQGRARTRRYGSGPRSVAPVHLRRLAFDTAFDADFVKKRQVEKINMIKSS